MAFCSDECSDYVMKGYSCKMTRIECVDFSTCENYKCNEAFLASNVSFDSTRSGSGTQQSTGQTAAHCGSS